MPSSGVRFAIDRGGTFTDVVATLPSGEVHSLKVLSVSQEYADAPSEGIRRVLQDVSGKPVTRPIPTGDIAEVRMGTTVATNALLERKGARVLLLVTQGFSDVLSIGSQARPSLFDLNICRAPPTAERVAEVQGRMQLDRGEGGTLTAREIVPLDLDAARVTLEQAKADGIESVAISLVHSFANAEHELRLAEVARSVGFASVSVSSQLAPIIKYLERTATTAVNAYLSPVVATYLHNFRSQFADNAAGMRLLFMQSDGGLVPAESFDAFRAVLSGPAGGVTGCARGGAFAFGGSQSLVGFDMGGTSTDVCRCVNGAGELAYGSEVAGVPLQFPQLDVHTVAAGGGSILEWRDGMFLVGPHSAGASPGPMCYGRGGPLTVTDANAMLGRVQPALMPRIFGPKHDSPIDVTPVAAAFEKLAETVSSDTGVVYTAVKVAQSFIDVANEQMCRPVRTMTEGRGYSCGEHVLVSFGGAGGQHACDIARRLGIPRVFVHRHASVLSAVGIGCASVVKEKLQSWGGALDGNSEPVVREAAAKLRAEAAGNDAGVVGASDVTLLLSLRYEGTMSALTLEVPFSLVASVVLQEFAGRYQREFGFTLDRSIVVDTLRVRVASDASEPAGAASNQSTRASLPVDVTVLFGGTAHSATLVDALSGESATVRGPALIRCAGSVVVVDPDSVATVNEAGDVQIDLSLASSSATAAGADVDHSVADPLTLTVMAHRFMSIAEQMGRALQQTAVSTNVKERLDFSCAMFDAQCGLVANAPHIPVHLGAMGYTVAYQREQWGADWGDDDVIVCNHPAHGGSHLPDITVITPIVLSDRKRIGYVACRAHHTDIGGSTPGSMPPFSTSLEQEGAVISGMKLVRSGVFDEAGITELLQAPGKVPGCSGCRALHDVLSDLRAQVAANHKGVALVREAVARNALDCVQAYMGHLQQTAALAVRKLLKDFAAKHTTDAASRVAVLEHEDYMDDGTPIKLTVTVSTEDGSAKFDFTGTGPQVNGSTNCPRQVVKSAILYSLRCLLHRTASESLPLNEGCLQPLTIVLPDNSLVSPRPHAAIVAGNVLTSQRITDVILSAFGACACSQGDMNNFTFGDDSLSYYETVCGGSGAGPDFAGADAVHTHMTNTRITDVEWLESRFPVLLREFRIRRGSGGQGQFDGGCGVVRSFVFLRQMTACMLSERRALAPAGLHGGGDGKRGVNLLRQRGDEDTLADILTTPVEDDVCVSLGGKATVSVQALDVFTMLTPGGGAFGAPA